MTFWQNVTRINGAGDILTPGQRQVDDRPQFNVRAHVLMCSWYHSVR
jgi:hypothetical protein